jgi:hypothetical protein
MKIVLTITIPDGELSKTLYREKMSRDQFKKMAEEELSEMGLDDDIPGTTATLEFAD